MNSTHLIICNRAASVADGWIHIVPSGELPNRAAGIIQVLDTKAHDAILAGIEADKARLGNKWPGVYAGREHFIYNDEADSAALAWFKEFEKRPDGIWAKADGLTPTGREVIANGEYKFTSFVADRADTEKIDGNRVRILKIDTVGFTNQANGKELLTPITNRNHFPGSGESVDSVEKQQQKAQSMKSVCTLLGLSADADETSVHAAVTKLKNRVAELEPLATENTELKNRIIVVDAAQVDAILAERKITDEKVLNRIKPILTGLKNREERLAFLDDLNLRAETVKAPATGRVLNRGEGKGAEAAATDEKTQADKIMNRTRDLQKGGMTFSSAHEQATRDFHSGVIK